jgi:hypothetical protein
MFRWLLVVAVLSVSGCAERPRTRIVPTTPAGPGTDQAAAHAVTKPPRGIATH